MRKVKDKDEQKRNTPTTQAGGADPVDATSPISKIQPLSKINLTFETMMVF